jgi:hypothetical protein
VTGLVSDGDALGRRLARLLLQDGGRALLGGALLGAAPPTGTDPRSQPRPAGSGPASPASPASLVGVSLRRVRG